MADPSPADRPLHPHDVGLPEKQVRKRRKNRFLAHWMLAIALITAAPGWTLYVLSVRIAQRAPERQTPVLLVIGAYVLLIISTCTLVLGLWYLLLAQVRRIARMTGEDEILDEDGNRVAHPLCGNCGWFFDPPDRFCRHCGKPLPASSGETGPPGVGGGERPAISG